MKMCRRKPPPWASRRKIARCHRRRVAISSACARRTVDGNLTQTPGIPDATRRGRPTDGWIAVWQRPVGEDEIWLRLRMVSVKRASSRARRHLHYARALVAGLESSRVGDKKNRLQFGHRGIEGLTLSRIRLVELMTSRGRRTPVASPSPSPSPPFPGRPDLRT